MTSAAVPRHEDDAPVVATARAALYLLICAFQPAVRPRATCPFPTSAARSKVTALHAVGKSRPSMSSRAMPRPTTGGPRSRR